MCKILDMSIQFPSYYSFNPFKVENSDLPPRENPSRVNEQVQVLVDTIAAERLPAIALDDFRHQFKKLVEASSAFEEKATFPVKHNRIQSFATTEELQRQVVEHAKATKPLLHKKVISLIHDFLSYKKRHGSQKEKTLYEKMTAEQFIDRLLKKRPLAFLGASDQYLLPGGFFGIGDFETIGTDNEQGELILENCLSYDEMAISALLVVSVPTHFFNNGDWSRQPHPGKFGSFEEKGVFVGLVGPRFEKPGVMEWKHILITPAQNTTENGYGKAADPTILKPFAKFYGQGEDFYFPSYDEAQKDPQRYASLDDDTFLNVEVYKQRIRMSVEPFLLDANVRAQEQKKQTYIHAVGLGLGVWGRTPKQRTVMARLMLEVYDDIIADNDLKYISDIDFSHFPLNIEGYGRPSGKHVINIHFSSRNTADKLCGEDAGKLLVAQYAWDGNSFPGNEYWLGNVGTTSDPVAMACSTLSELQNPNINPSVCGQNVHIADLHGIFSLASSYQSCIVPSVM